MKHNLNIIGTIPASTIVGDFPKDAQYARCGHKRGAITKFYKFKTIQYNDNTSREILHYWSEQSGWYPSGYNGAGDISLLKLFKLAYE